MDPWKNGPEVHPPCDHQGQDLHREQTHSWDLPRLARTQGRPSCLLRLPGSTAANCGWDAARLAETEGKLPRRGRGWPQCKGPKPQGPQKAYSSPTRQGPVPRDAKGAHRLPRVGSVWWRLEDRRPHPDLETESSRPSTGASIPAPQGPLSRHPCAPPVLPQRQPEAKRSSHHSRHWPQRRAGSATEQQLRKTIANKLVAYKRQDQAKRLRFNLKVDHILLLKKAQNNHCAACNIELLWVYQPKDTQQFSVDRLDNAEGHTRDNIRLTCLECNKNRDAAVL